MEYLFLLAIPIALFALVLQWIKGKKPAWDLVLFKYSERTEKATLLRHYRISYFIAYACFFSWVVMVSSTVEFVITKSRFSLYVLLVSLVIAAVLAIPGIFCSSWASEIEGHLRQRGVPLPFKHPVDQKIEGMARKFILWFALLFLVLHVINHYTS
jgi:hypothetical protein